MFADIVLAQESQETAVGDLRGLSPNAQTMVKMAVLSAWADLQVARANQSYLNKVLEPHVGKLLPLWLSSLQEFARLRFEPDISTQTGPPGPNESLEAVYAALNRQTLLKVCAALLLKRGWLMAYLVLSRLVAPASGRYCKLDRTGC